jgi:hypothetical protein
MPVIFTHYSTASFISHFFIRRRSEAFFSFIRVLPSDCAKLYCMLDVHLFLQPQFTPHREHTLSSVSCDRCLTLFSLSAYVIENTFHHNNGNEGLISLIAMAVMVCLVRSHKGIIQGIHLEAEPTPLATYQAQCDCMLPVL